MNDFIDLKEADDNALVSVNEICAYLRVHKNTWWKWQKKGKTPKPVTPEGFPQRWKAGEIRKFFTGESNAES